MEPILLWSRNRKTNITGSKCNGIRVIGDKDEEVDRADVEDLVNYGKNSISNEKPLKNSKQGTVIYILKTVTLAAKCRMSQKLRVEARRPFREHHSSLGKR